ncbi:hypothetical protein ACH5RR_006945 [Cinchona calisaya]|uniref:Uncharacterized protein n=1 Tax=Cinchona calisaya TaxID=153742 RepID=A0ABD3AQI3_9GENT
MKLKSDRILSTVYFKYKLPQKFCYYYGRLDHGDCEYEFHIKDQVIGTQDLPIQSKAASVTEIKSGQQRKERRDEKQKGGNQGRFGDPNRSNHKGRRDLGNANLGKDSDDGTNGKTIHLDVTNENQDTNMAINSPYQIREGL